MRFMLLLVFVCLLFCSGCQKKKAPPVQRGPLVPTARERAVLRDFRLTVESERGQRKIRELRVNQKRIDEARDRTRSWAEMAQERDKKRNK